MHIGMLPRSTPDLSCSNILCLFHSLSLSFSAQAMSHYDSTMIAGGDVVFVDKWQHSSAQVLAKIVGRSEYCSAECNDMHTDLCPPV